MLRVLLLALLLPTAAASQTTAEALGRSLLNPSWFEASGLPLPDGGEAFFAAAHQAYAEALGSDDAPADAAAVDALARTALDPAGWPDAVADAALYGAPISIPLADSALVVAYAEASGFTERLALVKWYEMSSPDSPMADAVADLLAARSEDELIAQHAAFLWYQLHVPLRYALREVPKGALQAAVKAYETRAGQAYAARSIEAVDALAPFIHEMLAWTGRLATLDDDDALPPLDLPTATR